MNICIVCGEESVKGYSVKLPSTFTAYSFLQTGNNICERCYKFLRSTQDYRRNSWLWHDDEIFFFKSRSEILKCLLSPPESNFMIYITKTRKKQGFILLLNRINFSNKSYWVAFDDDLIFIQKKVLEEYFSFISKLRERKITKTELESGVLNPYSFKKCTLSEQEKIKKLKNNKMWLLLVYLVD